MNIPWRKRVIAALVLIGLNVYACNEASNEPEESANGEGVTLPDGTVFTRSALLESFGTCIMSELEAFDVQARAFVEAVNAAAEDSSQDSAAREAWNATIDRWQELEVLQFGPAGRSTIPGGQDLRNTIYAWPLVNSCAVDGHVVAQTYVDNAADIQNNANGLGASEYLLFNSDLSNTCAGDDDINVSGSWDALSDDDITTRRAAYAVAAAQTVSDGAAALFNAWSPTGENFLAELTEAGSGSRYYGKKRVAINAVSDALFYIEWATKDNKLARPLGLIGCEDAFCVDLVESVYGRRSLEHLKNNVIGFRKIFTGCGANNEGLGFDDYLYAVGQEDLAADIDQAALGIIDAIDAIDEEDMVTALVDDLQSVSDVHGAATQLTDLLRNQFLAVLNLELPQLVQSDND